MESEIFGDFQNSAERAIGFFRVHSVNADSQTDVDLRKVVFETQRQTNVGRFCISSDKVSSICWVQGAESRPHVKLM